jgi:hypothetical protein
MTSLAIEGACAFAWRNYLLRHSSIREDDSRRSVLYSYITNLRDTGHYDFDIASSGGGLLEKFGQIA